MPVKPTWLLKLPQIQEELEAPVVDRACFERVFGVRGAHRAGTASA